MSETKPSGIVMIRGKAYQTVALRVQNFRERFPDWRLVTTIIERSDVCVVMKAEIFNGEILVATGHAEEYRRASDINKTSALENCETSAIGRALASLGIGGTEFASADEVARAVSGEKASIEEVQGWTRTEVMKYSNAISDASVNDRDLGVLENWDQAVEISEEFASAVWHNLTTPVRDHIRRLNNERRGAKGGKPE